jgi:ligand-binding sensor domain-containing protein
MESKILTVLFSILLCGTTGKAQKPIVLRLEEVTLPAKTPLATIDCLFEDSRGFLWIGAYSGLYRFDGYEIVHYQHDPADTNSIGDNKITCMLEDPAGNFWVGTQGGLHYFDIKNQRFKHYSNPALSGLGKEWIASLAYDSLNNLWAGSASGLFLYQPDSGLFSKQYPLEANDKRAVMLMIPSGNGLIFDFGGQLFYVEKNAPPKPVAKLPARINNLKRIGGKTWAATDTGLFLADLSTGALQEVLQLRGEQVIEIYPHEQGLLVPVRGKGFLFVNERTVQAEGPVTILANGAQMEVESFKEMLPASNGISWYFELRGNLYKSDARKKRFGHGPVAGFDEVVATANLFELYEYSPGVLLIPSPKGHALLDLHTGKKTPFPYLPKYNRTSWDRGAICFLEEADSLLWIGANTGLFLFDKKNKRFVDLERQFPALRQLNEAIIRKIHRDRKGHLWLASWSNGLYRFDTGKKTLRQYFYTPEDIAADLSDMRTIYETPGGQLWFGGRGGLLRYLEDRDSFIVYRNDPEDPESMSDNTSFCIYEDAEGNIWSGSYGGGLNCLDPKTGKFKHYTTRDGLVNNNVFSLIPDGRGNLWISGFGGLSVFNLEERTVRTFKNPQGLLNDTFDGFLFGKSRYSNTFFFGGPKGVDFFKPDSVLSSAPMPKVWFTNFKLFNEKFPVNMTETNELTLRYDQNVLTFDYAALEYSSPETVQYAYWLAGFDTSWQYAGEKRSITFTNLDPGNYTLKVKASNSDGEWDPAESNVRTLEIRITPPWWQTWWFRISLVLAIGGLVVAFFNFRLRQVRERAQLNQRIAQVKMEALRSQMNPHFVFNCLSSIKLFVEKNETEKASGHISKFAALLRRVLDDARTETETVPLERELDTLQRYVELEMIRFKDKFSFHLDIDPDVDICQAEVPPLILQPFVENAILHGLQNRPGTGGLLAVRVRHGEEQLRIEIEDNGAGREAAQAIKDRSPVKRQSHGLNVTAERLDFFTQKTGIPASLETTDLRDDKGHAAGTLVILSLQIN